MKPQSLAHISISGTLAKSWRGLALSKPRDIKVLIIVGHAIGYPLAVFAPIFIDPVLKSHVVYSTRSYPYALLCVPIYVTLLFTQFLILRRHSALKSLYASVCIFFSSIIVSLPIFLPEFPHGNVLAVGIMTAFLSAFAIFVWSIGERIFLDKKSLDDGGDATFEYMKVLFSFVRQGAFAGVTLFGALFLAAFATAFKYTETTVTDKSDIFLLNINGLFQLSLFALYSIVGPIRYFFLMNLKLLTQFKTIAEKLDKNATTKRKRSDRLRSS